MLTISTTHTPATDLGYLLLKNPERVHEVSEGSWTANVLYPEANEDRCTVALLVEIDPVNLVRGPGGSLTQYVNDRPYTANSLLCVAMNKVFGTAFSGKCKYNQELAETPIPLEATIPCINATGGEEFIRRLFEPLGYTVEVEPIQLDETNPTWTDTPYFRISLQNKVTVQTLLQHLYVLLMTLDARKHYFVSTDEVGKLIRKGSDWLNSHPEKNRIIRSFLGRKPSLIREALEQLANLEPEVELTDVDEIPQAVSEEAVRKRTLHEERHDRVIEVIRELQPTSVLDLGCGEGRLIRNLIKIQGLSKIVGMDVSYFELEKATRRLQLEDAGPAMRERVQLIHGSLMYRDDRLEGFDVAAAVEVIEHLDAGRLHAFERVVFECARPKHVLVTTPNREYNVLYENLEGFRHGDHRFEWTRAEFEAWANAVADRHGYKTRFEGLGASDETLGSPSQMAVFSR